MNRTSVFVIACAALATTGGAAFAHIHITVDTLSGNAGDPISIRAGYLPSDAAYSIGAGGHLLVGGEIAVFNVADQLSGGMLNGWYAGTEIALTSDFYYATGRLDGGNFRYELAAITPLAGGSPVMAWGTFGTGGFTPLAFSNAPIRLDRSFNALVGGHQHGQGYAFSAPGLYDVSLAAWDNQGHYTDSGPLMIRFNVVPAPGTAGVLALAGAVMARRRR